MRWLGRLLALLLAAPLAVLGARWLEAHFSRAFDTSWTGAFPTALMEEASRSTAYRIPGDTWLFFPLLPHGFDLRILTNAQLPLAAADPQATSDQNWRYALAYRLLDGAGTLIEEGRVHQRTRLGVQVLPDGRLQRSIQSETSGLATADGRAHLLPTPDSAARNLALRVDGLEPPLATILGRVFQREQVATHKLAYLWSRLSANTRERLGKASIYGTELLRPEEQRALLSRRWEPLAPAGIVDQDFQAETLYQFSAEEAEPLADAITAPRQVLGPDRHAIVPIPSPGGRIRVELTALADSGPTDLRTTEDSPAPNPVLPVLIRWYGRPATRQAEWKVPLGEPFEAELDGGLLEIISSTHAQFEVWVADTDGNEQKITPDTIHLRAWQLTAGNSLAYRVAHAAEMPTPWRIDLRQIQSGAADAPPSGQAGASPATPTTSTKPTPVRYRLLGASGEVLRDGVLPVSAPLSVYDQVAGDDEAGVSEASPHYFLLPPEVERLELSVEPSGAEPNQVPGPQGDSSLEPNGHPQSDSAPAGIPPIGPIAVAAYSRPPGLPPVHRVPPAPPGESLPVWFPLRPQGWPELIRNARSLLLRLQPSPPQVAPELLAGEYRWDAFLPRGDWQGRHLLIPAEAGPVRTEALPHRFLRLKPSEERELTFPLSAEQAQATLAYQLAPLKPTQRPGPTSLRLLMDGKPLVEHRVRARSGELRLPPFASGLHRILLDAPTGAMAWINGAAESFAQSQDTVVRRLAARLGPSPLIFAVPKEGRAAELLSLRVYGPIDAAEPRQLRVSLAPVPGRDAGPFTEWTLTEQVFQLNPAPGAPGMVLQAPNEQLDAGALAFIPLGSDLPAGDYNLTLNLEAGQSGYVTLSRTLPGRFPWRAVRHEL